MKFKLIFVLSLCINISGNTYAQTEKDSVLLNGTLINFKNEIQVEDMSEMKELELPNSNRNFLPDSIGKFSIKFKLTTPNYFRLGRNILYLSPGDSLTVFINYLWPDSAIFLGNHSLENEYLKYTPFPKAGSFLEAGDNIKGTIQQTIDYILSAGSKRQNELDGLHNRVTTEFQILENVRIKADIVNSLGNIRTYYPDAHKLTGTSLIAFETDYRKLTEPYFKHYSTSMLNPRFLKLAVYRNVLSRLLIHTPDNLKSKRKINDWIKSSDLASQIQELKTKKEVATYASKIQEVKPVEYRKALSTTFSQLLKFGNGDIAKDFIFENINGQFYHLKEFAGKVIYIDLWATWCGPCIEELPYLDSLRELYKNNKEIIFITLSIDNNKDLWRKTLVIRKASGIQGIIDRNKLLDYMIATIPRTIIINKNFEIVNINGPLPSDRNVIKVLNDLIK